MKFLDGHLGRAAMASFWAYSGRVVGLGWTVLIISKLGIADYGKYSIAMAAAAVINATIDSSFYVRALRIDDDRFDRERCARTIFGCLVGIAGILCFLEWYVVGFAVIVAAGELLMNVFKSQYIRGARPDIAVRFDTIRQLVSIGLAAGTLVFVHGAGLHAATWLYVSPYLVVTVVCLRYIPGRRPAPPGGPKQIALLATEMLASAIYAQGDVLAIGAIAGAQIAGYYSVASVTAAAIALIGQNYANTYVEKLRAGKGHITAAPPMASTVKVAVGLGVVMLAIGVGVLIWGGADQVGVTSLILSAFVFARSINFVNIVILFLQHRDALRVRATLAVAAVKMTLLVPAVHLLGAYGAAISCVVCEVALLAWYHHVIYRRLSEHNSASDQEVIHP